MKRPGAIMVVGARTASAVLDKKVYVKGIGDVIETLRLVDVLR